MFCHSPMVCTYFVVARIPAVDLAAALEAVLASELECSSEWSEGGRERVGVGAGP